MDALKPYISKVADGGTLDREEAAQAFFIIISGQTTPAQTGAFLMALRVPGESLDEIFGAVLAMRKCGPLIRIKTQLILSAPAATGPVPTMSPQPAHLSYQAQVSVWPSMATGPFLQNPGQADALKTLGVNIDAEPECIARCINEIGLGFMFAPTHHPAMRHIRPVRTELATRTIFNILGPLSNPAGGRRQLIGVFSPEWVIPIARTLQELDSKSFWAVHGSGLDKLTTAVKPMSLRSGTANCQPL